MTARDCEPPAWPVQDGQGTCVWDEDLQMFLAAPTPTPLVVLDFGEPYETPDGP